MATTKMNLAFALIDLLKEKSIKKVTVGNIANKASYSRETFYYHFQNKYDLIEWMHYFQNASYFNKYIGKEPLVDTVERILQDMKKIELFYVEGFSDTSEYNLKETVKRQTINIYTDLAKKILEVEELPQEILMSIYYSVYGAVNITEDWFLTDNDLTVRELAEFIVDSMNENLRDILSTQKNVKLSIYS